MKTVIKGFIHYKNPQAWERNNNGFMHSTAGDLSMAGYIKVQAHDLEIEVPDNFDPRPQQVAALQAEQKKVRAEFAARIVELDRQISTLTCLEAA